MTALRGWRKRAERQTRLDLLAADLRRRDAENIGNDVLAGDLLTSVNDFHAALAELRNPTKSARRRRTTQ